MLIDLTDDLVYYKASNYVKNHGQPNNSANERLSVIRYSTTEWRPLCQDT